MNNILEIGTAETLNALQKSRILVKVDIGEKRLLELVILSTPQGLVCIDSICPHSGGPLYLGDIEDIGNDVEIICPWHAYRFSCTTGQPDHCLEVPARVYKVLIQNSCICIVFPVPAKLISATPFKSIEIYYYLLFIHHYEYLRANIKNRDNNFPNGSRYRS